MFSIESWNKLHKSYQYRIIAAVLLIALSLIGFDVLTILGLEELANWLGDEFFIIFLLAGFFYFLFTAMYEQLFRNPEFEKIYPGLSRFLRWMNPLFAEAARILFSAAILMLVAFPLLILLATMFGDSKELPFGPSALLGIFLLITAGVDMFWEKHGHKLTVSTRKNLKK